MNLLLYDASSTRHEFNEPLGLEAIMGYLQTYFPEVRTDLWMWSMDGVPEPEQLARYDVIGLSLPYHSVKLVRAIYPHLDFSRQLLVLGNSIATFGYAALLEEFPRAVCSLGEGECTFEDLVRVLEEGLALEQVRNLAFRRGDRLIVTRRQEVPGAKIPCPARPKRVMDFLVQNRGTFRIEASRGCDYGRCSFCYLRGKYTDPCRREIPEARVVEQICALGRLGAKNPYFTDEDFIGRNYQRAIRISHRIRDLKRRGILDPAMRFYINLKVSDVLQPWWPEVSSALLGAGIDQVFVGIESGAAAQLKRYHKPTTIQANRDAVVRLREAGFDAEFGFICFDPLVTLDDLMENLDFIRDCQLYEGKIYLFDCLRVTIGSEYYDLTCGRVPYGPLDLDTLSYAAPFVHRDVQEIWDLFFPWKQSTLERFYRWQLQTRGESRDEGIQDRLKTLHVLEYSAMRCLAEWKKTGDSSFLAAAKTKMRSYEAILDDGGEVPYVEESDQ